MGRFLVIVGILMLVAGIAVPIATSLSVFGNFGAQIEDAINPSAEEYCNPGETIETTAGASSRTTTNGFTTGRVMSYFCENSAGERREVTDAVNRDIIGSPSGFLGSIGSMVAGPLAAIGLSMGGIVLIIAGVLMSVRSRARVYQFGQPYAQPGASAVNLRGNSPVGTSPFGDSPVGVPPAGGYTLPQPPPNAGGMQGDVVDFVRNQLDTAYRNGQISRDDYDRAVEKLNRR
jgi:hypothetical protein